MTFLCARLSVVIMSVMLSLLLQIFYLIHFLCTLYHGSLFGSWCSRAGCWNWRCTEIGRIRYLVCAHSLSSMAVVDGFLAGWQSFLPLCDSTFPHKWRCDGAHRLPGASVCEASGWWTAKSFLVFLLFFYSSPRKIQGWDIMCLFASRVYGNLFSWWDSTSHDWWWVWDVKQDWDTDQ